ncbi:MAG: hypothetical protein D6770_05515 [Anaerolineae bacterium]|nr:MAG: hypothetical protein D6770_05515 [Anaerolineae bacterium]
MTIEFDEKGKIFTDVITKDIVPAVVQTTTHRIRGLLHVRRDERLKDELDRDEPFLAITEATIYSDDGGELFQSDFVAVQRAQIVWVMPEEEEEGEQ